MSIAQKSSINVSAIGLTQKLVNGQSFTTQSSSPKNLKRKYPPIESKSRLLDVSNQTQVVVGSVSKTKDWIKKSKEFIAVYIVEGKVLKLIEQPNIKSIMVLQDEENKKSMIRCIFFESSEILKTIEAGDTVRVTGRQNFDGSLVCFSLEKTHLMDKFSRMRLTQASERSIFLSNSLKSYRSEKNHIKNKEVKNLNKSMPNLKSQSFKQNSYTK